MWLILCLFCFLSGFYRVCKWYMQFSFSNQKCMLSCLDASIFIQNYNYFLCLTWSFVGGDLGRECGPSFLFCHFSGSCGMVLWTSSTSWEVVRNMISLVLGRQRIRNSGHRASNVCFNRCSRWWYMLKFKNYCTLWYLLTSLFLVTLVSVVKAKGKGIETEPERLLLLCHCHSWPFILWPETYLKLTHSLMAALSEA